MTLEALPEAGRGDGPRPHGDGEMAYLEEIDRRCHWGGRTPRRRCREGAEVRLRNHRGEAVGDYCRAHGTRALAALEGAEAQARGEAAAIMRRARSEARRV